MRACGWWAVAAWVVGCAVAPAQPGPDPAASPERIQGLITRLGSAQFREREAAGRELDALGEAALDALRKAAAAGDPEARLRATELADRIGARLTAARLLKPSLVALNYNRTPLIAAVEDLARRTGAPIKVANPSDFYGRTVTIRTDPLPFWMAVEQFCDKAGLHEDITRAPHDDDDAIRRQQTVIEELALRQAMLRRMGVPAGQAQVLFPKTDPLTCPKVNQQIVLHDGSGPALPIHRIGSVRVRALRPGTAFPTLQTGYDHMVMLQVSAEPSLGFQEVMDVGVDNAIDDRGQCLMAESARASLDPEVLFEFLNANRDHAFLSLMCPDGPIGVVLRRGELRSTSLRELSGIVTIHVQTPQVVAVLDRPMTAVGKPIRGEYGLTLQLTDWTYHAGGEVRIAVHANVPTDSGLTPPAAWVKSLITRAKMARDYNSFPARPLPNASDGLSLENNLGWPLSRFNGTHELAINSDSFGVRIFASFRVDKGAAPARLVLTIPRPTVIEVPFTLHDVPLR